jgi:hypothetical protein
MVSYPSLSVSLSEPLVLDRVFLFGYLRTQTVDRTAFFAGKYGLMYREDSVSYFNFIIESQVMIDRFVGRGQRYQTHYPIEKIDQCFVREG